MTFDRRFIEIDFQRDYFIEVDNRLIAQTKWRSGKWIVDASHLARRHNLNLR